MFSNKDHPMNRFLYKYTSLRDSFFEEPMIRATPSIYLNDPFETHFNTKQVREAIRNHEKYYTKNGIKVSIATDSEINDSVEILQSEFRDLGIISLTEDYNNPLMWAHYANQHKGMVIEFDLEEPLFADSLLEHNGRKTRFGENNLGDIYEYPEKVYYRRERPSFFREEFAAPDSMGEFHWKKFQRTILFTKANDWIYEKEHRSVVRLKDADSIICKCNEYATRQCNNDKNIQIRKLENDCMQIIYPRQYEMNEDMGDESLKSEIYRNTAYGTTDEPVYLFRLNPEAIKSIYFGCWAKHHNAVNILRNKKPLPNLKNIYKMKINNNLYQLEPIPI
jgi:hypothetical protein